MQQAPGAIPPVRCPCSPVFDGGMLILTHLACCTPEISGPQEPENVFAQVLAAAGRLARVEMVRTEGRQAGMGQASAAAASLSMFPNRNLSIKPQAALPCALEACSKSTSRFQTGHTEHPYASGFADMVPPPASLTALAQCILFLPSGLQGSA